MIRLYCPELNKFVDPTDHNVIIWYKQHRHDPTIGMLQTFMLYEETRRIPGDKEWDEKAHKIRYGPTREAHVSGRYRLYEIPWSGLYDQNKRPIFHGDILTLHDQAAKRSRVCEVHGTFGIRFLNTADGSHWNTAENTDDMAIIDSAVLNPNLVGKEIKNLFVYPSPKES